MRALGTLREIDRPATWNSPAKILENAVQDFRRDRWEQQHYRVLLCSEKSTVAGTVKPVTQRYGVGFLSLHGYSSATLVNDLAALSHLAERGIPFALGSSLALFVAVRRVVSGEVADEVEERTRVGAERGQFEQQDVGAIRCGRERGA